MVLSESLKKTKEFTQVYKNGISYANRYLVMYKVENGLGKNRIGISVSKKVGNSVVRHRVTRLIRESYRLNQDKFFVGYDIVVVARAAAKDKQYKEIESALLHVGKIHKIVKEMIES
ncbi:MAG: ribonuclease P protein component [bacterium]|nr:ribonuclease P protein component [bacterium]